MQVVTGVDPHSLQQLLLRVNIHIEGPVHESYDKLYLNFQSPQHAQQAVQLLRHNLAVSFPGDHISAVIKKPSASTVAVTASIPRSSAAVATPAPMFTASYAAPPQALPGYGAKHAVALTVPAAHSHTPSNCTLVIETSELSVKGAENMVAKWQQEGELSGCSNLQTVVRLPYIYVSFATAAQASNALDSFNQGIARRYLHRHGLSRAVLKSSLDKTQLSHSAYDAATLSPVDEAYYSSAGLLCVRRSKKNGFEVLLGREHGKLTLLGGKRNLGECSALTAMREFSEETAYQLGSSLQLLAQLIPKASVIWVGGLESNAKYALYILDLEHACDSKDAAPFHRISSNFERLRSSPDWRRLPVDQQEMQALEWIKLDYQSVLAVKSHTLGSFLGKLVVECQPLRQWASDLLNQAQHSAQPMSHHGKAVGGRGSRTAVPSASLWSDARALQAASPPLHQPGQAGMQQVQRVKQLAVVTSQPNTSGVLTHGSQAQHMSKVLPS